MRNRVEGRGRRGAAAYTLRLSGRFGPPPNEAHLSAEEAQASPHARFPSAHAHARRQADPEAAPEQGPQAAHGVAVAGSDGGARRRGRRQRLSRSADFDRVYREGRSHATRHLVLYAFPRTDGDGEPRLGVSVGRKVGGAVERNRVKRLLREAFRSVAPELPDRHDFVVVARPEAGRLAREGGEREMEAALRQLVDAAGLIERPAA